MCAIHPPDMYLGIVKQRCHDIQRYVDREVGEDRGKGRIKYTNAIHLEISHHLNHTEQPTNHREYQQPEDESAQSAEYVNHVYLMLVKRFCI